MAGVQPDSARAGLDAGSADVRVDHRADGIESRDQIFDWDAKTEPFRVCSFKRSYAYHLAVGTKDKIMLPLTNFI